MRFFNSSLAVYPSCVLIEEVKKSTWNKSTRNRKAINFCLVLTSLEKFHKFNCPSLTPKKRKKEKQKKSLIGAISNKVLTVIPEAESREQQCLSRAEEEAGQALCARAGMPI